MKRTAARRGDHETLLVGLIAVCVSFLAFLYYYRHGWVLLYGDAVAHINIARRVFDSRTPGLLQLGTVWLPLPHLLMMPFVAADSLWRSGIGGSIPSMAAYVLGVLGIFRLVRGTLSFPSLPDPGARLAAWLAAGVYAANPNLIYLQSTAMTEPVYLAFFIWAVVFFSEFVQQHEMHDEDQEDGAARSLVKSGWCVLAACLTRYDGWFVALCVCVAGFILVPKQAGRPDSLHRAFRKLVLLAVAGPVFWIGYNGLIYRNPWEFANGPYSAKAIEQRTSSPGTPAHPGANHPAVAALYFLKSVQLNVAAGGWGRAWLLLAIAGSGIGLLFSLRLWPLLLLWVPVPFYVLSVAYGGVPIFLPVWWPFSFYNTRYGLELLPAIAVGLALAGYFLVGMVRNRMGQILVACLLVILVAASYAAVWREHSVCFREAWVNSRTRMAFEHELALTLEKLPPNATLLMYLGDHVGALQDADIPLQRVINEGNHRTWKRPSDPEGLWERALADPAKYADYVVAIDHDPVALATKHKSLEPIAEIHVGGQPAATVYWTHAVPASGR
jgi:hypothetical protein